VLPVALFSRPLFKNGNRLVQFVQNSGFRTSPF